MFTKLVHDLAYDVAVRDRFNRDPEGVCTDYGLDTQERALILSGDSVAIEANYRAEVMQDTPTVRHASPTTVIAAVIVESPEKDAAAGAGYWSQVMAHCEQISQ